VNEACDPCAFNRSSECVNGVKIEGYEEDVLEAVGLYPVEVVCLEHVVGDSKEWFSGGEAVEEVSGPKCFGDGSNAEFTKCKQWAPDEEGEA